MCRYRLRLHSEVIIWRGWSTNGSPFVRGESGYDVEHDANAQKAKNHRNLWEKGDGDEGEIKR
jgi:hypothetical protein